MQPLTLYVETYVKKFLVKTYGREPILIRDNNELGKLFSLAFGKDSGVPYDTNLENVFGKDERHLKRIRFEITWRMNISKLTEANHERLGRALEEEVQKAIYFWVMGSVSRYMNITESTRNFFSHYNIVDDIDGINIEAARKKISRKLEKSRSVGVVLE